MCPVKIEGVYFMSIVDCGSPVSIINKTAAVQIAKTKADEDLEWWNRAVKFPGEQYPFVDYNGNPLSARHYMQVEVEVGGVKFPTFYCD